MAILNAFPTAQSLSVGGDALLAIGGGCRIYGNTSMSIIGYIDLWKAQSGSFLLTPSGSPDIFADTYFMFLKPTTKNFYANMGTKATSAYFTFKSGCEYRVRGRPTRYSNSYILEASIYENGEVVKTIAVISNTSSYAYIKLF